MASLGAALVVFLAAGLAVVSTRWVGDRLNPVLTTAPERVPSAGGVEPDFHAWNRFHIRYYAMALLFLAFDMEMVFMYPWAVVFVKEGLVSLVEMLMFILILVVGIVYAWRERGFEWA
ncbi:NAD(P)H-quinone oxidoreductase subunit 3 [bacterium BMS3Abin02]|nr:NAD(P)H-quinone oxidoreductase subunit 3 [bacterium BMS3Abin02]HDL48985.1 NADH-quinone oxidoreductase subunit A [Actinomycetota bacterium]